MDFVSTRYGHMLCELGAQALRKYAEDRKQYIISCNTENEGIEDVLGKELKEGARFVSTFTNPRCERIVYFVLEK